MIIIVINIYIMTISIFKLNTRDYSKRNARKSDIPLLRAPTAAAQNHSDDTRYNIIIIIQYYYTHLISYRIVRMSSTRVAQCNNINNNKYISAAVIYNIIPVCIPFLFIMRIIHNVYLYTR